MSENGFKQKVTRIKGLSDRRRLPRLGVIRLGIKGKSGKTGNEYPIETDYFVCPDEVKKVYGATPRELEIMIPINDIESVFPCAYKYYGSSKGLKCSGNGEIAYRANKDTGELDEIECPCSLLDEGKCKQTGSLQFMIPSVSVGGVYQITTSSFNSIVDINSGLDYVSALLGRFAMVPLKIRRVQTETHHDDKKQNHYTLQIIFDADIKTLNSLREDTTRVLEHPRYQLPKPESVNPEMDPPDVIVDEEDIIGGEVIPPEEPPVPPKKGKKEDPLKNEKLAFMGKCTELALSDDEIAQLKEFIFKGNAPTKETLQDAIIYFNDKFDAFVAAQQAEQDKKAQQ